MFKELQTPTVASFILVACLITIFGCDNKTIESAPDTISIDGETLRQRVEQKIESDKRLSEVKKAAERLNRVYKLYQQVTKSDDKSYTPMDFIIDVSNEFEATLPTGLDGKLVRSSIIKLPIKDISPDCQYIETLLESTDLDNDNIEDMLTYSFKSCGTNGQYLTAIVADWSSKDRLTLTLVNENLKSIFADGIVDDLKENAVCNFDDLKRNILDNITCTDLKISLSSKSKVIFNNLSFYSDGEVRFQSAGQIFKDGKLNANFKVEVPDRGTPTVEVISAKDLIE